MAKFLFILICSLILAPHQSHAIDNIILKVGYSPGGGYDTTARLVGRHLGRFLPGNPSVTVQNVPGGGSLKLTKLMVHTEPKDGSVIAMINASTGTATVLEPNQADFDANSISWIGALGNQVSYCYVGANSEIATNEEFFFRSFKMGATGRTSQTYLFAALVKNLFNPKIDIVVGFSGGTEIDLAVERGELAARCGNSEASLKTRDRFESVRLVGYWGLSSFDESGVGSDFLAMIDDEVDKKAARLVIGALRMHYPIILPPDTPPQVVETYRAAFDAMVADPAFLADAKRLSLEIRPTGGAEVAVILKDLTTVDQKTVDRARELIR